MCMLQRKYIFLFFIFSILLYVLNQLLNPKKKKIKGKKITKRGLKKAKQMGRNRSNGLAQAKRLCSLNDVCLKNIKNKKYPFNFILFPSLEPH